jgi:hypothetical protein
VFHRIAVVRSVVTADALVWRLRVHPRVPTTYVAEALWEPRQGVVRERARSRPLTIRP